MAITESTYYGFTRLRNEGPEAQSWAAVDYNWELVSRLIKTVEQHTHDGANTIKHPGYDYDNDAPENTVFQPDTAFSITEDPTETGIISAGSTIGVRLAYQDNLGLETEATVEQEFTTELGAQRPDPVALVSVDTLASPTEEEPGIPGGTYIYAITLGKATGETSLSDVLAVSIPFSGLSTVTVELPGTIEDFEADGVDQINVYRSTGLSSTFQKVGEITDPAQLQFTDSNFITPENQYVQPPTTSTYAGSGALKIDWSDITHPVEAKRLLVYVTPEGGLWATDHLLATVDLTVEAPDEFVIYYGSESLDSGWPKNNSEIVYGAQKINLSTEATGGLALTATSDFNGQLSNNFRVGGAPTVTKANGMIWYDSNTLYARVNGSDITVGTVTGTLDWANHQTENAGGHIADNIPFKASSAVSVKDILDVIVDSEGARTNVQPITVPSVGSETTTSSTSFEALLTASSITREFASQWVEVSFSTDLLGPTLTNGSSTITFALAVDGVTIDSTQRSLTTITTNDSRNFNAFWAVQLDTSDTVSIEVLWKTDGNTWTAVEDRRQLYVKQVY